MHPIRRLRKRRGGLRRAPEQEAAARARRARDHLAKKRERERVRLRRERDRHEISEGRQRRLRWLTPIGWLVAAFLGWQLAIPLAEALWLADDPVEQISVQGTRALTPEIVAAGIGPIAGQPIDELEPAILEARLLENPWIESARVLRLPGGTLVVRVVEREAVARWQSGPDTELVDVRGERFAGDPSIGGALPMIAATGTPLGALPAPALEILREVARFELGSKDRPIRLRLPEPVRDLTAHPLGIDHARSGSDAASEGLAATDATSGLGGYVLEVGEAGPHALLGRRLFAQRVARLAALLDQNEEVLRSARLIDLRFADRAVLRADSSSG